MKKSIIVSIIIIIILVASFYFTSKIITKYTGLVTGSIVKEKTSDESCNINNTKIQNDQNKSNCDKGG